jgi:hypothetical protein
MAAVSAADVLITGVGAAVSAAVTAGVNALHKSRSQSRATVQALADLVVAAEMVSVELDPESQQALKPKIAAARAVLGTQ